LLDEWTGGGGGSLNQPSISAQMDRASSLNSIPANNSGDFPGEAYNSLVFDSQKAQNYIPDKPDLGTPLWLVDRDARDWAKRAKLEAAYREIGQWKKADKVASCRSDFDGYSCPVHNHWVALPYSCKDRLCPPCQRDQSHRLLPVVQELIQRMRWPSFVTLTVPNLRHLEAVHIDMIRQAFQRLRDRRSWRENCPGAIYRIEVTYTQNRDESWNLHMHFVGDIEFWESADLAREWFEVLPLEWKESLRLASSRAKKTFDSIVKICRVGPKHTRGEFSLEKVAQEMTKYFVKGQGSVLGSPNAVAELAGAIKGKRLFGAVGCFYGEDKKIREALQDTEPSSLDCPHCLANGVEDAGLLWMGRLSAADVGRGVDGGWIPSDRARSRLMADFMSREFFKASRSPPARPRA